MFSALSNFTEVDRCPRVVYAVRLIRISVGLGCLMSLLAASSEGGENWGATGPVCTVRPSPGAPVSARQVEERTQILADGTAITDLLTCQVYRDSAGRVRIAYRLGDGGGRSEEVGNLLDPVEYSETMLLPEQKIADRGTVPRSSAGFQVGLPVAGRALPKGKWNTQEEALGVRVIEGIEAQGTRWVATSEEQPALMAFRERWSSQALGLTLEEKVVGPNWAHTVKLQNLNRGEPDPALFVVPFDYTVQGQ